MQNKELCLNVEAIANEKQISQDEVFLALEEALALACEKRSGYNIRIYINRDSGEFTTYRRWLVVKDDLQFVDEDDEIAFDIEKHIRQKDAGDLAVDAFVEKEIDGIELGRIAAQIVKQVVIQKIRESERSRIISEYESRVGEIINTTVKRVDRGTIYVDLGGMDGIIPKSEAIANESIRKGERIKVYIKLVSTTVRGVQIILSRRANELLAALFAMEVPEIAEGLIEVMGVARDPGLRAKVALRSRDKRIDAIGSAIGMRGSRIQAISDSINGERIDVILWNEDIAKFAISAMEPATIVSIVVDEDEHSLEVAIEDEQLAMAIGKNGQNIRLASEVIGWHINAVSKSKSLKKQQDEAQALSQSVAEQLGIDISIAKALIAAGLDNLEAIIDTSDESIANIEGFDIAVAEAIKDRAQEELLAQALDNDQSADVLSEIEGVDEALANVLVNAKILTQDDLAELSIDELIDIYAMDRERAAKIILAARAPWFE